MPTSKLRVKHETSLAEFRKGRLKATEPAGRGSPNDDENASLVPILSAGQRRRDVYTPKGDLPYVCSGC